MSCSGSRPASAVRKRVLVATGLLLLVVLGALGLQRDRLLLILHPERRIVGQWRLYSVSEASVFDSHFPLRYGFEVVLGPAGELLFTNVDGLGLEPDPRAERFRLTGASPPIQKGFKSLTLTGPDTVEIELESGSMLQYRRYVEESP